MKKHRIPALLAALVLAGAGGCSLLTLRPPFDATGSYTGTWTGTLRGGTGAERSCKVTLKLEQDPAYSFLQGFAVKGAATVYFTCASVLGDVADAGLPGRLSTDVTGFVLPGGTVSLASIRASGTESMVIGISGNGEDRDENGAMDGLKGNWSLSINQPGFSPLVISGTVAVAAQ
ncbi:MAG: hypothetical protein GX580_16195 [Candidatus Hydrogenedens sp.]|nr:hypothetical protein [Candidatus Hydrogenedentota bacterium]NLF59171.1 hypothetical protein [Candidatus Hydrogenedens sp.]